MTLIGLKLASVSSAFCELGIFQLLTIENDPSSKESTYSRIWIKSSEETEKRRWALNNPGIGEWEIKLRVSNKSMKKTVVSKFSVVNSVI